MANDFLLEFFLCGKAFGGEFLPSFALGLGDRSYWGITSLAVISATKKKENQQDQEQLIVAEEVGQGHTLNTLNLASSKASKGALVLGSREARTNRTLEIMDGSASARAALSGHCRIRHLLLFNDWFWFWFRSRSILVLGPEEMSRHGRG